MDYKDVIKDLKNHRLDHLYLFYGEEQYLLEHTLNKVKETIINSNFEALNYQILYGQDLKADEIINACETLPFMGEKRMVCIKDLEWFSGKGKNITLEEEKKLFKYLKNLPDTTHLFFIMRKEVDKRRKIFKLISEHGQVVEFSKLKGNEIYKWIEKIFRKCGKKIDLKTIVFFLDFTGYLERGSTKRLTDLENEIIKISSYMGNRCVVEQEDIKLLIIPSIENNIFRMLESIGTKESGKSFHILNEMLLEGEPIAKILYMIIKQFRFLYQVKLLETQGYTPAAIRSKLNIQSFQVKKYLKQAKNFNLQLLRKALDSCLYVDESVKKGRIEPKLGIELLIGKFAKL